MRLTLLLICLLLFRVAPAQDWQVALSSMPLVSPVTHLNRTNCVDVLLHSFRSNAVVKALIFMPGATDEFYMFRRASAELSGSSPTLLDAVLSLTRQSRIQVDFRPPLLLLHTDEDNLEPLVKIEHPATAERLQHNFALSHALYNDRDWDTLQPLLKKSLQADMRPWRRLPDSWHFYRHSFAGWNLTGWEALNAVALAGKSGFVVRRNQVIFVSDRRVRSAPGPAGVNSLQNPN